MIYTVTLNPSIDYIVRMKQFVKGITNRTRSEEFYVGGKGINVSFVLSELGVESTAFGFVAGFTGDAIVSGLQRMGVNADFIRLREGNSRINVKIKAMEESEINCQGPDISEDEFGMLLDKLGCVEDGDTIVLAGAIPTTLGSDTYVRILDRLRDKKIRIIVDARKKLLTDCLKYKPFLIKPNRQELSEIFVKEMRNENDIIECAFELKKLGAMNVLISLGPDGVMLIDSESNVHRINSVKHRVINTVGSGNSLVAGFIAGYDRTQSYDEALLLGTACANATSFCAGLATRDKIDEVVAEMRQQAGAPDFAFTDKQAET